MTLGATAQTPDTAHEEATQATLEAVRLHLARASREMASAATVLRDAARGQRGTRRRQFDLIHDVVDSHKDVAASLARIIGDVPLEDLDLLFAGLTLSGAARDRSHN